MVRELAWRILRSGSAAPLREIDRFAREHGLDPRDRAFLRRIVGTEIRRRATLRALARQFATGKPDADLAAHLHVGLVQLFFLDQVPDHAAVAETVGAVRSTLGPRKAGYVNAVLRAAIAARRPGSSGDPRRDLPLRELHLEEPFLPDPAQHPFLWMESALSIPAPLARRFVARLGEERARALALSALVEPDLSLRASGSREPIARGLKEIGCSPRDGLHQQILIVPAEDTEKALGSELFARGAITVQGETALRSAELLEAAPRDRLLDACAAPGGKTAILAVSGARVVACDASLDRLLRVGAGLRRLRPSGRVELVASDAAGAFAPETFDGVLADVPCSNTGVLAQRPEARWRFGPASMRSLASLQERILSGCAARVRPGGRLVYSTCSLEPEENRLRIEAFLKTRPDFSLEAELEALPDPGSVSGPTDGGYAARLHRT
jgi:16S rRNA (cytosine967-C5)-methyltransferase